MQTYTYIIILNWNGLSDTLECLESVFQLSDSEFRVIVCDNGSGDNSLDQIKKWTKGQLLADISSPDMTNYSRPIIQKPISYQCLKKPEAENNLVTIQAPLILIDCEENLGFAGGNNIGLRLALQQPDMDSVWLLNNDTVVDSQALIALRNKMQIKHDAGIIGSTVRYYNTPEKVQAFGGARYYPFLGMAMHIGRFFNQIRPVDEAQIERQLCYIMGASMFVTRSFLESVGLMQEDYFLYYEELDWAERARGHFSLAYASQSHVFHKAGSSIGSSNKSSQRSFLSDRYLMGNRLKVTQRFYPKFVLSVRIFLIFEAFIRLLKGQMNKSKMILQIVLNNKSI